MNIKKQRYTIKVRDCDRGKRLITIYPSLRLRDAVHRISELANEGFDVYSFVDKK